MNYSLVAAHRMTHVKIVLVALIAGIAVTAALVDGRPTKREFTAAPASGITIAVPSGMKSFPTELLPQ